jgi:hypothetical protein
MIAPHRLPQRLWRILASWWVFLPSLPNRRMLRLSFGPRRQNIRPRQTHTEGYAVRSYRSSDRKKLRVIRLVRNVFAHAMVEVTFTTPEIVAACHEIVLSPNAQFFVDQESQREIRYRFCYGCDPVFRGLLGFLARPFIFGTPPIKPSQPILP